MAERIIRAETAFALSTSAKKRPRVEKVDHLAFIRKLPCVVTGLQGQSEACHLRYQSLAHGKPETGLQRKPGDMWTVPMAALPHRKQHAMDERLFWRDQDINPLVVASLLWAVSGDEEAGRLIIRSARVDKLWPWTS